MNIIRLLPALIASSIFYSSFSLSGIITFDTVNAQDVPDQTFILADYQFTTIGSASINDNSCGTPRCADNGTQSLVMNVLDRELGGFTLSHRDALAFNLLGFDVAETFGQNSHAFRWAESLQLTATKIDGSSFIQLFKLDWINDSDYGDKVDFESFSVGHEFSNLLSINFIGIGGDWNNGFSIDNISVETVSVPEPASLLIFLFALSILVQRRKKR